jgi:hypothetical protein
MCHEEGVGRVDAKGTEGGEYEDVRSCLDGVYMYWDMA